MKAIRIHQFGATEEVLQYEEVAHRYLEGRDHFGKIVLTP